MEKPVLLSRRYFARSSSPLARFVRYCDRAVREFSLPAPRIVFVPLLQLYRAVREVYYFLVRVLVCEPLFKAECRTYGKNVHTGTYIHWIDGKGDIVVGDNVLLDGKCSITFGARYSERPTLRIGNNTGIGHLSIFRIARAITIGDDCRIAGSVTIMDVNGHPTDAESRRLGLPLADEDIKPVTIQDNVWLGRGCLIMPGVTVGEGSIVAAAAVVLADVAPYSIVAGNPARKIGIVPHGPPPKPRPLSSDGNPSPPGTSNS